MIDVHVTGGERIALVAKRLRQMGTDRTIVNNMTKRIRRITRRLDEPIRKSARDTLPHKGGLGEWVAQSTITTSVRRSARTAGVQIVVGKGQHDIAAMEAGNVRHPLWGNRKHWYPQKVEPGFGAAALKGQIADEVRQAVSDAIDDAVAEVLRG